jgi:MerR family mercuric resistance operon transcriptional regulator
MTVLANSKKKNRQDGTFQSVAPEQAMEKLTSTKAAEVVGIHVETLRYYERIGLAPIPAKTPGGHRVYSAEDIETLLFIRRARTLGFSIDEIRLLQSMTSAPDRLSVRNIAKERLNKLSDELEEKRIAIEILSKAIAECESSSCGCQILEMLKSADKFASLNMHL